MTKKEYIGAFVAPEDFGGRFSLSLYLEKETGIYFTAKVEDDSILFFNRIEVETECIVYADVQVEVSKGSHYIYSFIDLDHKLVYGKKTEIQEKLLPYLTDQKASIHLKLILTSFLNLFSTALDLIDKVNKELSLLGSQSTIDDKLIFNKRKSKKPSSFLEALEIIENLNYQFKISGYNPAENEVFFFHERDLFFGNYMMSAEEFIEKCIERKDRPFMVNMGKSISHCSKLNKIDIAGLIGRSDSIYRYFLFASPSELEIDQINIERNLSGSNVIYKKSILDIGIEMDRKLYGESATITQNDGWNMPFVSQEEKKQIELLKKGIMESVQQQSNEG